MTLEDEIAAHIDRQVEPRGDDDGGLVLDHQGRSADAHPRPQLRAAIGRHCDEGLARGVEELPLAEPTPALVGTMMRAMPSFSATRAAWSGAAPPNATRVRSARFLPRSIAWTRAAFAMFSSTISLTPRAASAGDSPSVLPTSAS